MYVLKYIDKIWHLEACNCTTGCIVIVIENIINSIIIYVNTLHIWIFST